MKIRRFFGTNIRAALKQVTDEFGNDAAILSNNKVAGGVEVIAAIDYDESLVPSSYESKTSRSIEERKVENEPATAISAEDIKALSATEHSLTKNLHEPMAGSQQKGASDYKEQTSEYSVEHGTSSQLSRESLTQKSPDQNQANFPSMQDIVTPIRQQEKVEWSLDPSLQAMKEELGLMRSMMSEQLKGIGWHQFTQQSPLSAMIMRRLSRLGLDNEYLNSLMPHVKQQDDAECAWQQILAILAKSIPIAGGDVLDKGGVFAFVGMTGVGKTTTIAKLAARYVIKHGADAVALISADDYRISAHEQLSTFARILQIESSRVTEKQNLSSLLEKYKDKSLVLIDTAGMNRNDTHLMAQLESLSGDPSQRKNKKTIQKLLVLSASSQGAVQRESVNFFGSYELSGIVISKLDEAGSLGELMSVVTKASIPVVYTTDGQRIPEDIRVARSHHLVSKAVWLANKYSQKTDDWNLAQSIQQQQSA